MYRIFLFSMLLIQIPLQAQITGRVIDENSLETLAFANIVLIQTNDSSFIAGTTSDENGLFSIANPSVKSLLRISLLGYKTQIQEINSTELKTIKLSRDSQFLSEVTVTASFPLYKMENGGISVNIPNSRLRNMGTASNVLSQLPFVTKEKDNYTVFGKGTPLIYINNRLIRDVSELEEINSANIKKVTVITNPGAEYDATIQSVIKIELIKTAGDGLGGNTIGNIILDRKFSHNELVNLNYRLKQWDVFGMFRFAQARDLTNINIGQSIDLENIVTSVDHKLKQNVYRKNYRMNLGSNYSFNNGKSIGLKYEFTKNPVNKTNIDSKINVLKNDIIHENLYSTQNLNNLSETHGINSYFNGILFPWLSVKIDMDYLNGKTAATQNVNNDRQNLTEYIVTNSRQNYNLYATKLILTTPVWNGKFTYGGEYSDTYNEQIFDVDKEDISQNLTPNKNIAKQNLVAFFGIFNKTIKPITIDVGLRYEHVNFEYFAGESRVNEQSRIYNNLFPNISLTYTKEQLQMMLSYRKTTSRPSYYQLRNNVQYHSPYTYESGNPYLKPIQVNSLSYLLKWKNFQLTSRYAMYRDFISLIPQQYEDDIILFQPVNIEKNQYFSISGYYSQTIGIWEPAVELSMSKGFFQYGFPVLFYNQPIYGVEVKNNLLIFKNLQLGVDINYNTRGNLNLYYMYEGFLMDIYLSKTFFDDKLRINLQGNDIFNTDRSKRNMRINNISVYNLNDLNSCGATLSVSYRFNATESKYKGKRASDEINRLQ